MRGRRQESGSFDSSTVSWDFEGCRFKSPPEWVVRDPDGREVRTTGIPREGVREFEAFLAELITRDAANAIIAFCSPSQDRLGRVVPRRHLAV
jgi:hypothetical protein